MFGGTTISLILPKLIRSVARDGIWTFWLAGNPPARFNQRYKAGVPSLTADPPPRKLLAVSFRNKIVTLRTGDSGATPANAGAAPEFAHYLTSTLAPASSSFFLAASESALFAPSSTGFGA